MRRSTEISHCYSLSNEIANDAEIVSGRILGKGGFCVVCEIKSFKLQNQAQTKAFRRDGAVSRESLAASCLKKENPRYCIKRLSVGGKSHSDMAIIKGTVDLALEAKYLAVFKHPNIVNLCGLAQNGPLEGGHFMVLERLKETLPKRAKRWVVTRGQCRGITGIVTGGRRRKASFLVERLQVAHGIASALEYMHEMNIIYRDVVSYLKKALREQVEWYLAHAYNLLWFISVFLLTDVR